MYQLISGGIAIACWVVAIFFLRFWKKTNDRLFQIFSYAFIVLGTERVIPTVLGVPVNNEHVNFVYIIRLSSFILILIAIVNKNRSAKPH